MRHERQSAKSRHAQGQQTGPAWSKKQQRQTRRQCDGTDVILGTTVKSGEGTNGLSRFAVYILKHGMPHSTKRHTIKKDRPSSHDADLPVILTFNYLIRVTERFQDMDKKNSVQLLGYSFV